MSKEAMKLAQELRALSDRFSEGWYEGIKIDASDIVLLSDAAEALASEAIEQPAPVAKPRKQEPVAVPTTSYEHRKFVLVGRDWYERFAAFHDDCQIGEQLTWQEKTVRQQGYENGWNDAQRYLKEPQSTSPTPAQPSKPLTDEIEALFTNIDHAISSGAWNVQTGSQTWELIQEAKAAHGIKGDA